MNDIEKRLRAFAAYVAKLDGDEKGEAQVFCDRLFQAFGWPGYKEAGARLEDRVAIRSKQGKNVTKYVDLKWPSDPPHRPGCLIEMKKRGAKLEQHYQQAFEYWQYLVPRRPRYVILCNFDEFWIYDFDSQLYEPVDRVATARLSDEYPALNFLFSEPKKPRFGNDRIAVTRKAADKVATLFNQLTDRGIERERAQRFILQCVVCLFADYIGMLPKGLFTELLGDCRAGASVYDLLGGLFTRMNTREPAKGGRLRGVPYFNGGLFARIDPVDLESVELTLLHEAAGENWSKVKPDIFGTLFQSSMDKEERHALGAHYTAEADIQKVVLPTIIRPWRERITAAKTRESLVALRRQLENFQVLDPACGSGNFLYVAYREMVRVEMELVNRLRSEFPSAKAGKREIAASSFINIRQFHGIDINEFAVELAKVTLLLAKKLAYDEVNSSALGQRGLSLMEDPLPLANLDDNLICGDALFIDWPKVDAIIGNPPYQSKNKMQQEYGATYSHRVRERFPGVPGRADYCVYWFRRAHDDLPVGGRAGLVGTNTIRQNYSREGGLDYIVANGGEITEAVSSQVWSGEAAVHVSIVNWIKGKEKTPGKRRLAWQVGDSVDDPWEEEWLDKINSALSPKLDVTSANALTVNIDSGACYQGQTHGHKGFLLTPEEAHEMQKRSKENARVLYPFLIGDDLLGRKDASPSRWVIDFYPRDMHASSTYKEPFEHIKKMVLAARHAAAQAEADRNEELLAESPSARVNHHHKNFEMKWWLLSYPRPELIERLGSLDRYIVCVRTTKRPVFEFVSASIRPNDALQVFPLADDYSFGILQSDIHWRWFVERCSTLKRDFRYTSDTVFDSFPWPQTPTLAQVRKVAKAAVALRAVRQSVMDKHGLSRRELYRQLEDPGKSPVKDAHVELDAAVRLAYGMTPKQEVLSFILALNLKLAEQEAQGEDVVGPGLPGSVTDPRPFITTDCVQPPKL